MLPNAQQPTTADPDQDSQFVTLARFNDPAEAQMARSSLEAAGISCFLQGENANSLIPLAFRARLLVSPQDEAAGRAVLDAAEFQPFTEEAVTAAEIEDEKQRGLTR